MAPVSGICQGGRWGGGEVGGLDEYGGKDGERRQHTHKDHQSLPQPDQFRQRRPRIQLQRLSLSRLRRERERIGAALPKGIMERLQRHTVRIRQEQRHHLVLPPRTVQEGLDLAQPVPQRAPVLQSAIRVA